VGAPVFPLLQGRFLEFPIGHRRGGETSPAPRRFALAANEEASSSPNDSDENSDETDPARAFCCVLRATPPLSSRNLSRTGYGATS
jgi:hypothetical protein